MKTAPRTAIFDLDGTLVDTITDITHAVNRQLHNRGLPPSTIDQARPWLGNGLHAFCRRAFQSRGVEATDQEIDAFVGDYTAHPIIHSKLYPDAAATFETLATAGWKLLVCTNKVEAIARTILQALDVLDYFDVVCGGDSVPLRKPTPGHLRETLARAQLQQSRAVMVGDHHADVLAAAGCGMPSIFALWGYGDPAFGRNADFTAENFKEVGPLLMHGVMPRSSVWQNSVY